MKIGADAAPRLNELSEVQQNLAVGLGSGYRVMRGVAGSGKTIVLIERIKVLASANVGKHYALFCFNNALAKFLGLRLAAYENVLVATIDSFASTECRARKIATDSKDANRFDLTAEKALAASRLEGTSQQFDAVFVDEAQDFDFARLDLAFASLKDPDGDFVIGYDTAQNTKPNSRVARWTPPGGRTARGRTTLMRINYRNTQEVLQHAYFLLRRGDAVVDNNDEPLEPDSIADPMSSRSGPRPRTLAFASQDDAASTVANEVAGLINQGEQPNQMAVIGGNKKVRAAFYKQAKALGLLEKDSEKFVDLSFGKARYALSKADGKAHGASFHKLKGLEYKHVYLMGLDSIEAEDGGEIEDFERLRRLVYTAMTRSTHNLTIALHGQGPMVDELAEVQRLLDVHHGS